MSYPSLVLDDLGKAQTVTFITKPRIQQKGGSLSFQVLNAPKSPASM
jgi:hypothetical protein